MSDSTKLLSNKGSLTHCLRQAADALQALAAEIEFYDAETLLKDKNPPLYLNSDSDTSPIFSPEWEKAFSERLVKDVSEKLKEQTSAPETAKKKKPTNQAAAFNLLGGGLGSLLGGVGAGAGGGAGGLGSIASLLGGAGGGAGGLGSIASLLGGAGGGAGGLGSIASLLGGAGGGAGGLGSIASLLGGAGGNISSLLGEDGMKEINAVVDKIKNDPQLLQNITAGGGLNENTIKQVLNAINVNAPAQEAPIDNMAEINQNYFHTAPADTIRDRNKTAASPFFRRNPSFNGNNQQVPFNRTLRGRNVQMNAGNRPDYLTSLLHSWKKI